MKRFPLIVMIAVTLGFTSCSDDDDDLSISQVPSEINVAFDAEFPNATDVEYETYGDQYIVEFEIGNVDYEALYNNDGSLVKYKYDILISEVPESITTTIATDYNNRTIDDAEILVIDDVNYYLIELNNTPTDDHIVFNEDGTVNTTVLFWD
ncbi:PepSY-like domain-containing protein [Winogradskyella undariae]|uniref:PepSY-like domain-containing protein n=1 Tax=Winogradskyella TaxID=286104 RepID=UPI00156B6092|nr:MULTISPECIES: PepSY-like domain-containing protein [Winogradskyella]NRR90275.1 PepSY-like domain-containing protein [Winogradskyella undariae]QXP77678.1 PepSY-like domain-containing protein [Winogradskyella sp. HaHa_3_26]